MVNNLLHLASLNDHPPRQTGTHVSPLSLNHTLTLSPDSDKHSQCVPPTATQSLTSRLEVLIPPTPDVLSSMSLNSFTSSSISSPTSTDSNSDSKFFACQALVRSDCQLRPRLPITYNKTTLRHLNGRSQVQTLNTLLLPLPNNTESDRNPSQSEFRDQEEESQSSYPAPQTIAHDGEVPDDTGRVAKTIHNAQPQQT